MLCKQNKKICAAFGDDIITEITICKQFPRFRSENFDLEECKHSSRLTVADDD